MPARLIPELDVLDLDESLRFYVGRLGFAVVYDRPEERFAFLDLEGAQLMLEEASGPGRRFHTGLERPLGRGMNLQIQVADAAGLYERLVAQGQPMWIELERRWYRRGDRELGNEQFVVADPDGYLLRFYSDLGSVKPARPR